MKTATLTKYWVVTPMLLAGTNFSRRSPRLSRALPSCILQFFHTLNLFLFISWLLFSMFESFRISVFGKRISEITECPPFFFSISLVSLMWGRYAKFYLFQIVIVALLKRKFNLDMVKSTLLNIVRSTAFLAGQTTVMRLSISFLLAFYELISLMKCNYVCQTI